MGHLITTSLIKVSAKDLSPTQKKFNRLTKSLQRDKNLLKTWSEAYEALRITHAQCILPLLQEMDKLRLQGLIQLDQWYNHKSLTKRQNEKLYDFIQNLAEICVDCDDSGQAEEIYNRYNEISFNEAKKEHYDQMQSELEDMLGVDLGENFDFESDTAFSEFIEAMNDKIEQEKSKTQKRSKKDKATTDQKKQTKFEVSESQSIKDVFRQLTKVLHPDREIDETERARKSELMQRANISYKNQDLLSLLELQFEIEQTNQATLDNLSSERLEAYNRLFQRQHQKIKEEIFIIKQRINAELNIPSYYDKPAQAQYSLERQQDELENQKKMLMQDLETFADIKGVKQWLNSLRKQNTHHLDIRLDDMFDEFF